jgi:hypothetical protein
MELCSWRLPGEGVTAKLEAIPLDGRIVMCMKYGKPKEAG